MLKVKQFLKRAIYVFRDRNGANEIIGSALLMVYTVLAVIPSVMGCAQTIDTAIQSLDNQLTQYLTEGAVQNGTGSGGSTGTSDVMITFSGYDPAQDYLLVYSPTGNFKAWDVPIPSSTPAGAKYVDITTTFQYILYDEKGYPLYQSDFTMDCSYDLTTDVESSSGIQTIYGLVTGSLDPYIVNYGGLNPSGYTIAFSLTAYNNYPYYTVTIYPTIAEVTFKY